MSKIGKRPIELPKGVTVTVKDGKVEVKGAKGTITRPFPAYLSLEVKGTEVQLGIKNDVASQEASLMYGTSRAHIANAIVGVSTGYKAKLLLLGTGYKAEQKGQTLNLSLGLSHPVVFTLPAEIKVKEINQKGSMQVSGKNEQGVTVELESHDKEALGQAVAKLQSFRPPEPYKGKGVNVEGQKIIRKAGKAGGKGGK
ncbi:MAG: 50S ribosomal protein L6 [Myxococcales bacterium]|nr:50S ribosomal protein L6 [Myxococcales bacterium]